MSDNNQSLNKTEQPLIEVKDLKRYFDINVGCLKPKPLKAVDGVSFSIKKRPLNFPTT